MDGSVPVVELTLATSVDGPDHIAKVALAQVHAGALAEQAVIELLLVFLGVVWRISDGLAVLFLGVASPHAIDWLLASEEVVALLLKHLSVANINT